MKLESKMEQAASLDGHAPKRRGMSDLAGRFAPLIFLGVHDARVRRARAAVS